MPDGSISVQQDAERSSRSLSGVSVRTADGSASFASIVRGLVAATGNGCEGVVGLSHGSSPKQQLCWTTRQAPLPPVAANAHAVYWVVPCN